MTDRLDATLDRYSTLTTELRELYERQADLKTRELTTYSEAWSGAVAFGVTERNKIAQLATLRETNELTMIDGELHAVLAELRFLDHLLTVDLANMGIQLGP